MDFVSLVSLLKKHVEKPFLAPTHLPPKNRQVIFADFVNFPDFFLENSAKKKSGKNWENTYLCMCILHRYVCRYHNFCLFFSKNREKYFLQISFLPNFCKKSAKNISLFFRGR